MNILAIDRFPPEMMETLRQQGHQVQYQPDWNRAQIIAALPGVEVLVMNSKINVDKEIIEKGPQLRMVCRAGVGMDHIDIPLLEAAGIRVMNTPGANAQPVGEQGVGMLLTLLHNISRADRQVREFRWLREENRGTELNGKTVGIIGYGNTGTAFARCASGFGCELLAYDKYKTGFGDARVREVPLETIFAKADVLTLHIPLTEETHAWVDTAFFARFAKPIYFLNLARGPIVILEDLIAAMASGKVIAAGLDVLVNEKLDRLTPAQRATYEKLFRMDRVVLTPHIGGWSHESLQRINDRILKAIKMLS